MLGFFFDLAVVGYRVPRVRVSGVNGAMFEGVRWVETWGQFVRRWTGTIGL